MKTSKPTTNRVIEQFTVHITSVHKDGDDTEVEAGDHRLAAGPFPILRQSTNQPVAGQHTDDVAYAHHTRGQLVKFFQSYHLIKID